jgi:hypothetical protein
MRFPLPQLLRNIRHELRLNPDQIGSAVQELYISRQIREQSSAAGAAATLLHYAIVTAVPVQAAEAAWHSLSLSCHNLQAASSPSPSAAAAAPEKSKRPATAASSRPIDARGIYESLSSALAAAYEDVGGTACKITLNLSGTPVAFAGNGLDDGDGRGCSGDEGGRGGGGDNNCGTGGPSGGALDLRVNGESIEQALFQVASGSHEWCSRSILLTLWSRS